MKITSLLTLQLNSQLAQLALMNGASGVIYLEIALPTSNFEEMEQLSKQLMDDLILTDVIKRGKDNFDNQFTFITNKIKVWVNFSKI